MKRVTGSGVKSWELTDGLWERVRAFIPQRKRDEHKTCQRKPMPPCRVLEAVFYVLRTGIQWKALPKAYGAAGSARQYFSEWAQAVFFRRMRQEGSLTYDEFRGLDWEWQRVDGSMMNAPLAREAAG
jgi:transposase